MRVEPNLAWKSIKILKLVISGSNPATRTMMAFVQIISLLMLISILLVKKTSYQEYGVAGVLISLVSSAILCLYLLFK